jgi:hypothetical protein
LPAKRPKTAILPTFCRFCAGFADTKNNVDS